MLITFLLCALALSKPLEFLGFGECSTPSQDGAVGEELISP